jgi:protein-S-isoprenylcysteine O-methyltransferase Ste14
MILGLIIVGVARATLDGYWGPNIYKYEGSDNKLITHGIYSKIRHPVYLSQFLMTLGTVFLINNLWIAFFPVFTLFINHLRALHEERDLRNRFPDKYPDYHNTTSYFGLL